LRTSGTPRTLSVTVRLLTSAVLLTITSAWLASTASVEAAAIKGTVQYVGAAVESKKLAVTVDQFVCGKDKDAEELSLSPQRGLRNAVVSLASAPPDARWQLSAAPVFLDQRQCVFIPRVALVPAGGTVEFLNSDRLLHNIHSTGRVNAVFNRTQPKGRTIPITFTKPEIVRIGCDLHGWMRAWVVVMEHPFHAVTGAAGEFTLDNVPPGKYTLNVWHETLGTVTKDVTLGQTDATTVIEIGRR
jgi:plastocyanin